MAVPFSWIGTVKCKSCPGTTNTLSCTKWAVPEQAGKMHHVCTGDTGRGESDLWRRSVYKSCWCIANALFGEVWGWQALLCSPRVICLQAVKQKCIWSGTEGCVCRQNHQVSKKMLHVIGSADWVQSQILLKAKLLKWWTEYTNFFFCWVQHNECKYSWWVPFLSLLVVFFLLSVDEISVFYPNNSPGHWSAALKPVLTKIKSAQQICVAASTKHWGAFSWPSLSNCSIHLFEKKEWGNGKKKKRCL